MEIKIPKKNESKNLYLQFNCGTDYWNLEDAIKLFDWLYSSYNPTKIYLNLDTYIYCKQISSYLEEKGIIYDMNKPSDLNCLDAIFIKYNRIYTCLQSNDDDKYRCKFNIGNLEDLNYKLSKQSENYHNLNYCRGCAL